MSWPRSERLYQRLPEIHRRRDREQGEPLRALLATLESQLELLEDDIAGLYENWFLETCQDWVIPYLADLLGVRGLGETPHAGAHPRVQVARTLEYRRRKGTPVALERATRDVTGWYARVVEMFELLAHTQNVAHPRPGKGGLVDLRRTAGVGQEDDPFAPPSLFRTVDVRRIASGRGRFNIPDLALHLWRLRAFPIADSPAAPATGTAGSTGGFFFDPLGRDLRLFNRPQTPEEIVRRAGEHHLPVPLRRSPVAARLADYYGTGRAFEVRLGGEPVAAADVDIADLAGWPAAPAPAGRVQIDPETGRIRLGAGLSGPVRVSYLYGFAAALGGGPYDRRETLAEPSGGFFREVSKRDGTLAQALSTWAAQGSARGVIRVLDSEVYDEALLDIAVAAGRRLVIEAADGERPVLRPGRLRVTGTGAGRALTLNGFLVDTTVEVAGSLELLVTHCTLVPRPGRPSLAHGGGDASALDVRLTFSITGALHLPDDIASLRIEDGILDAASAVDGAMPLPALVSGTLADPPSLGTRMELSVQLGAVAARTVTLSGVPTHVAGAAALLQQGIRAGGGAAYGSAVVTAVGDRLLVRSGSPGETVAIAPSAVDQQTAGDLGLLVPPARAVTGVLSGELAPFPAFSPLQVRVTLSGDGPHVATLAGSPQTLDEAAAQLQAAIRAARQQILFTQATVARLDDRLLVRPGIAGESVAFAGSAADPQTVTELALTAPPAARAEGVFSGRLAPFPEFPGPEVTVTMGATGPSVARLFGGAPSDLADLAGALQNALRNAEPAPFPAAQVLPLGDRLLVRDGAGGTGITFAATATDAATVVALALATPPAERLDDGRLSTSLVPFPAFPRPSLLVDIDGDRRAVALRRLAGDLGAAREAMQEALRAAAGTSGTAGFSPAFATAEVLLLGDRLLVRSGSAAVTVLADPADAGTAAALALDSGSAGEPQGLLSGEIETFPAFQPPALGVSFGGRTVETATLTGFPRNVGEARALLEEALHAASATAAFTRALVAAAGDRLLVASGVAGEAVRVETVSADPLTATDLALVAPPAVDVNGLLSGELYPFPVLFQPTLRATIGATGPRTVKLAGVPTDAATAGPLLQDALRAAHTNQRFANATVEVLSGRLLVRPGIAGEAVTFEATAEDANSAENLGLVQPPARPVRGLMSGDLAGFAGLPRPRLRVTRTLPAGSPDTRLVSLAGFPADLDQARSLLETALGAVFSGATVARIGNRLLLQPGAGGAAGALLSAAGATTAADNPTPDSTTVTELGLGQPPAEMLLLSGDLAAFPVLPRPRLSVTLGGSGTQTAELLRHPADLATARASLENAIRAAAPGSPSFTGTRVEILDDRLLVLPGTPADTVTIGTAGGDTTSAGELRFTTATAATAVTGLYSGALATFPTLTAATPSVDATLGSTTRTVTLTPKPTTLAEAATRLQAALQAATPAAATFTGARVLVVGGRLLVLPGVAGDTVSFAPATGDATTVNQLALGTGSATTTQGLLSGVLTPFPALTVRAPAVLATLANTGPRTATFETVPTTLAEAAASLQAALRATTPADTAFGAATVQVVSNRLEVRAGTAGSVTIAIAASGATTATDLKLTAAAGALAGLYSGDLSGFAGLSAGRLQVSLGGTSAAARLAGVPTDLASTAAMLQAAVRAAAPGATTFASTTVEAVDTRLLVTPGVAGDAVVFTNAAGTSNADLLALTVARGAVDLRGLLSGPVAPVMLPPLAVIATLGGTSRTIDLGAIPTGVADLATVLQAALRGGPAPSATFAGAQVLVTDDRVLVLPGTAGDRVAFTAAPSSPEVVSQIRLDSASASPIRGLLSGSLAPFPILRMAPAVQVTLGASGPLRAVLGTPRSFQEVALLLEAGLRQDPAAPGTLRPASFTGARVRLLGGRLLVTSGNPAEAVEITDTASGPATASALGLITTGPGPGAPADGWLGGPPFPVLRAAAPQVAATFGTTTVTVPLAQPADVVDARSRVQTALQAAGFAGARVELYDDRRLLVLSSAGTQAVSFAATAADADTAPQLSLSAPTAARVTGLLSGSLASFPVVSAGGVVEITLGTDGPYAVPLPVPGNLAAARALLEAAIRQARTSPSFVRARVLISGDRLLVLPGVAGEAVVIDDVLGRPATATQLRLVTAQGAVAAQGWLGGDPAAFRGLATNTPRLTATLGGIIRTASLTDIPDNLAAAAPLLQSALRAADSSAAFAGVTVEVLADRLRVRSGTGGAVTFANAATGSPAATLLGLSPGERGLLSGSLAGFAGLADDRPAVGVTLGGRGPFRVTLAAPPSGLADSATLLQAALRTADGTAAFTGATVAVVGERLHVTPGNPRDTVSFSPAAGREADLVSLGLDPGSLVPAGGLLSGPIASLALRGLPRLQMRVQNGATVNTYPLTLTGYPADLESAAALLEAALRPGFPLAEVEVLDGRRLLVSPGVAGTVSFEAVASDAVSVVQLRLHAAQAVTADGLLSGRLTPFPRFASSPAVRVQIGTEGPFRAALPSIPSTLEAARQGLEEAIRGAHASPAFYLARVVLTSDRRLVVLPGRPGQVVITPTAEDTRTVDDLKLRGGASRQVGALLSALLPPQVDLTAASPRVHVSLRSATGGEDFDAAPVVPAGPVGVSTLAAALEIAIRAAPAVPSAWVIQVGGSVSEPDAVSRLVVVPDTDDYSAGLSAAATDATTVAELGFEVGRALGGGATDDDAGPPLSLERVTVLGRVVVRELREASAVLFSQPVRVQRRHVGCVRYSYLPDGSETPRRYRCQPDLALALAVRQALDRRARETGATSAQQLPAAERADIEARERQRVLARLEPRFASTRFGDPGYAHLTTTTAPEILTGAEDGSEMGAFHHLQEPARRRQLAILLEEYLRFGLDAGIFHVTESTE